MAELTVPQIDFSSLGQLPQIYRQNRNEMKLADLGRGLADGSIDYKSAAAQTAGMGDITHTLQFLALAEARKKQEDELAASQQFTAGVAGMYGAQPGPAPTMPNPAPVPGARPAVMASTEPRLPVASSPKVWGDAEAEAAGLYEPKKPAMSLAMLGAPAPAPIAAPAASAGLPSGVTPRAMQLIAASGSPRLPQAQREVAKTLLAAELDSGKATSDMKEWAFAKSQDPATPDYTSWARANKAAGKTEISIDTKGETKFAEGAGKVLSTRFEKLSEEGQTATQDLALVGQLRDLGAVVKTGAPAAIQGWLAERGIKVGDNVGAVEAYGSIIDKLTPQQRVPGSGATSDYEGRMFKNSLPKLINTPEGNEIISNTLAGLAQYKLDRAAIAERALTREITPAEALKQMRDLPNPYQNFKDFTKTGFKADPNNPASATPPAAKMKFTAPEIDQSLANARAAISANPAKRDAILKKLRDNGLPTDGL